MTCSPWPWPSGRLPHRSGDGVSMATAFPKSRRLLTADDAAAERKELEALRLAEAKKSAFEADLKRKNPNLKVEL